MYSRLPSVRSRLLSMCNQVGTPICVPTQGGIDLGRIASLELNHKAVEKAKAGQSVAMKIEPSNSTESRLYGRHFDHRVSDPRLLEGVVHVSHASAGTYACAWF